MAKINKKTNNLKKKKNNTKNIEKENIVLKKGQTINKKKITKNLEKKINKKNIIIFAMIIISVIIIIISAIHFIKWNNENKKTKKIMNDIIDNTEIEEVNESNDSDVEIIEQVEDIAKDDPYWDYIKMSLINVNFDNLKERNSDVVGWIQVNGTNINYPFVQTTNNSYYLTHSIDKNYTDAGWVFLDYQNNLAGNDKNTIIYAHSRLDKSMFGTLRTVLTNGWLKNKDNYIIKLSTEYENTLWQVFSVYHLPTEQISMYINFYSENLFLEFANDLIKKSAYNFNTGISENDRILTLSTCYNDKEKLLVHAKLIKKETNTRN